MTWLDDIGTYLQTNSIGTLGTDIFYRGFDLIASNCIALYDQAGDKEETGASNDFTIQYPELGVRVRNQDDATAESKIHAIHALLHEIYNTQIGSTYFISIEAIADPFFIGNTENEGFEHSCNFSLEIEV